MAWLPEMRIKHKRPAGSASLRSQPGDQPQSEQPATDQVQTSYSFLVAESVPRLSQICICCHNFCPISKSVGERGGDADADRADGRVLPRRAGPGAARAREGGGGLRALPALGRRAYAHRTHREYSLHFSII